MNGGIAELGEQPGRAAGVAAQRGDHRNLRLQDRALQLLHRAFGENRHELRIFTGEHDGLVGAGAIDAGEDLLQIGGEIVFVCGADRDGEHPRRR
jgi:hypothetical protein